MSQVQLQSNPFWRGWRTVNGIEVPLTEEDLLHPVEGDVIVQNDPHNRGYLYLYSVLDTVLGPRPGHLVLADHLIDWGHETIHPHCPDVVAFDNAPAWDRTIPQSFNARELGVRPLLIVEVTSPSTRNNDLVHKRAHYLALGIPFYLIVDRLAGPRQDQTALLAFRRVRNRYQPAPLNAQGRVKLPGVPISVGVEERFAVCYNDQGEPYPLYSAAMARIEAEVEARDEALRQLAEVDAALRTSERNRQQAEESQRRAEGSQRRAEESQRRAEGSQRRAEGSQRRAEGSQRRAEEEAHRERTARQQAEANSQAMLDELARLRAELAARGQ